MGTAMATNPAAPSISFLRKSSLRPTRSAMIQTIPSLHRISYPVLVFRRPLDMIDDENLHGALLRFQFQTKLLLNRREHRRPGRIRRRCVARHYCAVEPNQRLALIRCPMQCEFIVTRELGLIQNGAA